MASLPHELALGSASDDNLVEPRSPKRLSSSKRAMIAGGVSGAVLLCGARVVYSRPTSGVAVQSQDIQEATIEAAALKHPWGCFKNGFKFDHPPAQPYTVDGPLDNQGNAVQIPPTKEQCLKKCNTMGATCKGMSYKAATNAWGAQSTPAECLLHTAANAAEVAAAGWVSASQNCKLNDVCYTSGFVYAPAMSGSWLGTVDVQHCQKRCQDTTGCAHFSWFPDGSCQMHDDQAVRGTANMDVIVGPKTCAVAPSESKVVLAEGVDCNKACADAGKECDDTTLTAAITAQLVQALIDQNGDITCDGQVSAVTAPLADGYKDFAPFIKKKDSGNTYTCHFASTAPTCQAMDPTKTVQRVCACRDVTPTVSEVTTTRTTTTTPSVFSLSDLGCVGNRQVRLNSHCEPFALSVPQGAQQPMMTNRFNGIGASEEWTLMEQQDGTFLILSSVAGTYLAEVPGQNGEFEVTTITSGDKNAKWRLVDAGGGQTFIRSAGGMYLRDPASDSTDAGAVKLSHTADQFEKWYVHDVAGKQACFFKPTTLFCWSVVKADNSEEQDLLKWQLKQKKGMFACDSAMVFADDEIDLSDKQDRSFLTRNILAAADKVNTRKAFVKAWTAIFDDGRYRFYDWIIKVQPTTVFLPDVLRQRIGGRSHAISHSVLYASCKQDAAGSRVYMKDSFEILSAAAAVKVRDSDVTTYTGQAPADQSEEDFVDKFFVETVGVNANNFVNKDLNLLNDAECRGNPYWSAQARCDVGAAAISPLKTPEAMKACYSQASQDFPLVT